MRILLVEDDAMIGKAMQSGLRLAGFTSDWARDGQEAELAIANGVYSLIILDLGLPKKSGLELLRNMRRRGDNLPVLIVTARDAVADRVEGLNSGADDYLVKPFHLDELIARLRALLRRQAGRGNPNIQYGALTLDPLTHVVTLRAQNVTLSAKEFALLEALIQKPGAVISREALEEALYGWNEEVESNAVEVHLHNLRKKLGADVIKNIRGVGYRVAEVE